jgi:maltose O-acetyltransferase
MWITSIISKARHLNLYLEAWLNGGHIEIGRNVRFNHKVTFQGKGCVVIKDGVVFGYRMAGLLDNRIILQVRNSESCIVIDEKVQIMNGCELFSTLSIMVGKNALIGAGVKILDSDFHSTNPQLRSSPGESKAVIVGENVWVGMEAMVLKGVSIGTNSVIASKSLVIKDVSENSLYAGVPAKWIKPL